MKVRNRVFAIFALILNILVLGAAGYGLYLTFSSSPDPLSALKYFTVDSNALLAVSTLIMIPFNIVKIAKPERPYVAFFRNLKFVAVVSTTITLVTAYAFLGPTGMFGTYVQATLGALDINIMLKSEVFFLHTLAPALGIISEIFEKDSKGKYKTVFNGFIPLAIYTIPYLVFAVVPGLKATYGGDWYGFLSFNLLSNDIANTAVLAAIAIVAEFLVALLFGTIIWALSLIGVKDESKKDRVTYTYTGKKDEPVEETKPVDEPKTEETSVEEVAEEQPEEVVLAGSNEEQPVVAEEIQEESVEEQQQALEETPVEEEPVDEQQALEETPVEEEPVDEQPVEKEEVEPEEKPEEAPVEQPAEVQPEESKTEEKPQEEKKVWPFQKKKEKKGFAKKAEDKSDEPKEEKKAPAKKPAAKKAAPAKKTPAKKAEPKKETTKTTSNKSTTKGGSKVAVAKKEAPKKEAPKKAAAPAKKPAAKKEEPAKFNGKARVYHISQHENGYKVKLAGGEKAIKTFKTQKEAIAYAKELVKTQGGSYLIHSLDGSIRKG